MARGCRSEAWLEREGDSWLPLDVFSVASVVGHVEDKEGRLSAEELRIVGDSSGESPQCMWTLTIYTFTIVSSTCMGEKMQIVLYEYERACFYPIVLSVLCLKSPIQHKQTTKTAARMLWDALGTTVLFRGRMNRFNQNGYLIFQDQDLAC